MITCTFKTMSKIHRFLIVIFSNIIYTNGSDVWHFGLDGSTPKICIKKNNFFPTSIPHPDVASMPNQNMTQVSIGFFSPWSSSSCKHQALPSSSTAWWLSFLSSYSFSFFLSCVLFPFHLFANINFLILTHFPW